MTTYEWQRRLPVWCTGQENLPVESRCLVYRRRRTLWQWVLELSIAGSVWHLCWGSVQHENISTQSCVGRKLCYGFAILKMAPAIRLGPEKGRTTDNSTKVVLMLEQSYEVVYLKATNDGVQFRFITAWKQYLQNLGMPWPESCSKRQVQATLITKCFTTDVRFWFLASYPWRHISFHKTMESLVKYGGPG